MSAAEIVLYREALALGLDKDDGVIRRRLGLKMEFLATDLVAQTPPADEDLQTYFETHRDRYRQPPRYLNPGLHYRALKVLQFRWPHWVEFAPGYAIGSLGAYWTIQRAVMMF